MAEARLEELLPIEQKFDREERSVDNEKRIAPTLDKVFQRKAGTDPSYAVECRANICRISVLDNAPAEWLKEIQVDVDARAMFDARSFGAKGAFVRLSEPDAVVGKRLMSDIAMRVYQSNLIDDCKSASKEHGSLTVTVVFDESVRRLRVQATGSLAELPAGICVRRGVEGILSSTQVPDDLVWLPEVPFEITII